MKLQLQKTSVLAMLAMLLGACGDSPTRPPDPPPPSPPAAPTPVDTTYRVSSSDVPKDIPNRAQTASSLIFPQSGTIQYVRVDVDIAHTWRGDVDVYLRHPDGTQVRIFEGNPGDSRDGIIGYVDMATVPALSGLVGKGSAGVWQLVIADTQPQDKGRLNAWSLTLRIRR